MFIDSQGYNLLSYKPGSINDSLQFLPRSAQPFPFLLRLDTDLTSSEKKNFSSWLQTKGGGKNPTFAKPLYYLGKDSLNTLAAVKKIFLDDRLQLVTLK